MCVMSRVDCELNTAYLHAVGHILNLDRPHSLELVIEASTRVGYDGTKTTGHKSQGRPV